VLQAPQARHKKTSLAVSFLEVEQKKKKRKRSIIVMTAAYERLLRNRLIHVNQKRSAENTGSIGDKELFVRTGLPGIGVNIRVGKLI
jgi:hypothetical protein